MEEEQNCAKRPRLGNLSSHERNNEENNEVRWILHSSPDYSPSAQAAWPWGGMDQPEIGPSVYQRGSNSYQVPNHECEFPSNQIQYFELVDEIYKWYEDASREFQQTNTRPVTPEHLRLVRHLRPNFEPQRVVSINERDVENMENGINGPSNESSDNDDFSETSECKSSDSSKENVELVTEPILVTDDLQADQVKYHTVQNPWHLT